MTDRALMDTGILPPTNEPIRVAARRMRWFRAALQRYLDHLADRSGCRFTLDDRRLARVYVRWLRAVEAQRPEGDDARQAYFVFAAGLMLREMVAEMPLVLASPPEALSPGTALANWPEGYACSMFCMTVAAAALRQEFDPGAGLAPAADDLRHWWSFAENVRENESYSIPFLEMFLGYGHDWAMPDAFVSRLRSELGSGPARDGRATGA
jgi:hypothetical protein